MSTYPPVNYMNQQWYANVDDLIGGWMVANRDLPASQLDPFQGHFQIADFISEKAARHVCELHNKHLEETNVL